MGGFWWSGLKDSAAGTNGVGRGRKSTNSSGCLTNFNMVLIKFWLQIDKDEQLKRFKDRQEKDYKQWKITDEDWRNREKWDHYEIAASEMIQNTSTGNAPWTVVESNNKLFARIKVLETFVFGHTSSTERHRPRPPLLR